MAYRKSSRSSKRSTGARRSRSGSVRRSTRGATRRASAPRKSARRSARRAGSPRGHQTVRIVLETAGAAPVREGEAVGIGQKVAKSPRVKPRF